MSTLLYIHGFLSSPASGKAVQVRDWLAAHRPSMEYHCPFLTPYFDEAGMELESFVESRLPGDVYLMGSSLGGYWATHLAEKYDLRAVLINPLVRAERLRREALGFELKNYHTDDVYILEERHADALEAADTPVIRRPENYWLLVQTGDETLDYRLAVAKYAGCRQLVEEGGDHGFQGFERHIRAAVEFLEGDAA
ncbi:MAG: YqiA/YcfP family alpha/beta fold hydrolase [Gammaproteobacteria bacterium]